MIIIDIFDNNNRKLNNIICISESINIDNNQAILKACIQHVDSTVNGHYTSVIRIGHTWYHCNHNTIRATKLDQDFKDAYIPFYKFLNL